MKGNPFHSPGKNRLVNATFSPNWSQSGEELLRAWEARYGQKCDGVIAIDLQALARLMSLTGPVQAEGVGELNAGNLVKVLAGSYDTYNTAGRAQGHQRGRWCRRSARSSSRAAASSTEKFQVLLRTPPRAGTSRCTSATTVSRTLSCSGTWPAT